MEMSCGGKVIAYTESSKEMHIGNVLLIEGNLMLYEVATNRGSFDAKTYYHNQGIYASIYVQDLEIKDTRVSFWADKMYQIRKSGVSKLYDILGDKNGALLSAMLFGDKNGMDEEQKERFQKVGISHIFAISGLHISLFCIALYQCIRKMTGSFITAGIMATVILISYILITGISVSAIRAGIMFGVKVIGDITGRVYDQRTSLGMAAAYIIAGNTNYLFDGAYLLSTGAILGVIYLLPIWQVLLARLKRFGAMLAGTIGIQMILLPIMLYLFFEICPYSIIANLIVIPCMPILLLLGLFSLLCHGFVPILGNIGFAICEILLIMIDYLSEILLSLPYSRIIVGQVWWPYIVLYYIGITVFIYYGKQLLYREIYLEEEFGKDTQYLKGVSRDKRIGQIEIAMRQIQGELKKKLGISAILLPLLLILPEPSGDISLTMIDVGQGDSIHITGPNGGNYLIDGGSTDKSRVGKYTIEPYLLSKGIGTLDYVFISHGDADHYNGIVEMMERQELGVEIKNIVVMKEEFLDEKLKMVISTAKNYDITVLLMAAGNRISEGDLVIECIGPTSNYSGEIGNASSMVLDMSYKDLDVLFTGDLEGEGELEFISAYRQNKDYEILKVAHHGSKNSTPNEFLELIHPQMALISAGYNSRYGHPHIETINRIQEYTEDIYTTNKLGSIEIQYFNYKKNIKITTFLEKGVRF